MVKTRDHPHGQALADAFAEAVELGWNWGDLDAFGELFHRDVVLAPEAGFPDPGPLVNGWEAVRRWHERVHAPVMIHAVEQRGSAIFAAFSWLGESAPPAGVTWHVLLQFTGRRATRVEYFRSRTAAECAWAQSSGAQLAAPTLCAAFQATAAARAQEYALDNPSGLTVTWSSYARQVRALAGALDALGVRHGDRIAVMLRNRPEFHLVMTAAIHLGAVPSPIYESASPARIANVITDSGCVLAFTEEFFAADVRAAIAESGVSVPLIVTDGAGGERTLADLMLLDTRDFDFDAAWRAVDADDELMVIYSSPAARRARPISVTHGVAICTWRRFQRDVAIRPGGCSITGRPCQHLFDRLILHHQQLLAGNMISCLPDSGAMATAVADAHPTFWVAPEAVLAELRATLEQAIDEDPASARVRTALTYGRWRVRAMQRGEALDLEREAAWQLADDELLAPLRARAGLDAPGALHVASGAGVSAELHEFFAALGVPILELATVAQAAFVSSSGGG